MTHGEEFPKRMRRGMLGLYWSVTWTAKRSHSQKAGMVLNPSLNPTTNVYFAEVSRAMAVTEQIDTLKP